MGPRKRWAVAFFGTLTLLYGFAGHPLEGALRRAWFRSITRALATDARGLAPPPGTMWLGTSRPELPQSLYGMDTLEAQLGLPLKIASFYVAWGEGEEHAFPGAVVENLNEAGYLPLITWEPWLNAFPPWAGQLPPSSLRIVAGGAVDGYIRSWAHEAVRNGKPLLLRPAHEPTNPAYGWSSASGNSAADYRRFWAHVRQLFREEGARNVLFVWTPFGLREGDWFPGADAVDWNGFDVFNFGGLSEQGTWLDFYTITKLFYDAYGHLGVPLLIAEAGSSSAGGNKADWLRDMFHDLAGGNFPAIRGLVLFDQPAGRTGTGLPVDWSFGEVSAAFDRSSGGPFARAAAAPRFQPRGDGAFAPQREDSAR